MEKVKRPQKYFVASGVANFRSPPFFKRYTENLLTTAKSVCNKSMSKAAIEAEGDNDDGIRDITASFDGTWQKRGHQSLNGAASAISVPNVKVSAVQVKSKFCRCPNKKKKEHQPNCVSNFQGTSGGMEVSAARRWLTCFNGLKTSKIFVMNTILDTVILPVLAKFRPKNHTVMLQK